MLITTEGIIIRIRVNDTALLGRVTSGVKLINLKDDITVASIARVVEDKSLMPPEETEAENSYQKNLLQMKQAKINRLYFIHKRIKDKEAGFLSPASVI